MACPWLFGIRRNRFAFFRNLAATKIGTTPMPAAPSRYFAKNLPNGSDEDKKEKTTRFAHCSRVVFRPCLVSRFLGSANRAGAGTSAAIHAGVSVDYILAVAFADCAGGTFCCTSAAGDAVITNLVSHPFSPP